jgi:hypothetical protein
VKAAYNSAFGEYWEFSATERYFPVDLTNESCSLA